MELFYDEMRIARHGAMPAIVQEMLFGHGSVHSLDGDEHRHRKATFVEVADEDAEVERLQPLLEREWRHELDAWLDGGDRTAYDAAVGALGRAIMTWAGLPGTPSARTRWSARLAQIVDGFGAPYSPAYLAAVGNRIWSDRHARRLIEAVRSGDLAAPEGTALRSWAWHRDRVGELLPAHLAGVELQNTIRPTIAVARFVAFAAKELHDRPEWQARIAAETAERETLVGGPLAIMFAQEIRRTAPFVPMLPGWATQDRPRRAAPRRRRARAARHPRNRHGRRFVESPATFDPERFRGVEDYEALTAFIPHGGADVVTGHRCPGEKIAISGLATAIAVLSDPGLTVLDSGLTVNRRRLRPCRSPERRCGRAEHVRCPIH